ncbi:putative ribonuclease H-like domain-containing protein [Tanacetum coccineum]
MQLAILCDEQLQLEGFDHILSDAMFKSKRTKHKGFIIVYFLVTYSNEPRRFLDALEDEAGLMLSHEELLQFRDTESFRYWARGGIDFDEVFAPVAGIEAIRSFSFASYMGLIVYSNGVKSAFLYGKIDEEVYVSQPPGFLDPKYPKKVYKVVKALYGLHQAPRAWYATLSTFLLKNGYRRGTIDKTLFIKKDKTDIILSSSLCG